MKKSIISFILLAFTFIGSLSHACQKDLSRNIQDGCDTIRVNFGILQQGLAALTSNDLNAIESKTADLIKEFGEVDSCKMYDNERTKYAKFMDLNAISSGIQKIRNGATAFSSGENKSLTPRELFVLAGLLETKLDVQAAVNCQR